VADGRVFGRGACDDKGQIAVLYLVLNALQSLGVELGGDLLSEIVIEEEAGGNGSLSLIRQGYRADGAVILEPTELRIHPANRGFSGSESPRKENPSTWDESMTVSAPSTCR
jgi:acetylornithine deacetylase